MRIKDFSEEQRPRERLCKHGASALSDAELLAIILKIGNKEENVIEMSQRVIAKYGLEKLASCSLSELQQIKGIGNAKACEILAAFELVKRAKVCGAEKRSIKSAQDVFNYFLPRMRELTQEQFRTLLLDLKNKIIKEELISLGTLNGSLIHPREVFKSAIRESANSIIIVHNHPSGDPAPSREDEEITSKLIEAGDVLGIKVLDHVIIGRDKYWSWKEQRN
ncbi:DNA repair protein RadC [Candidatus Woesearchaeota archaeon]|nr:DNA repair protein RadC [Candidatus Woesearchaeota archaeon]